MAWQKISISFSICCSPQGPWLKVDKSKPLAPSALNGNPGSPGFLTGANFNTGIANIPGAPVYTIGYNTSITNGPGADFGVVTARFSTNDTITLTINGQT